MPGTIEGAFYAQGQALVLTKDDIDKSYGDVLTKAGINLAGECPPSIFVWFSGENDKLDGMEVPAEDNVDENDLVIFTLPVPEPVKKIHEALLKAATDAEVSEKVGEKTT